MKTKLASIHPSLPAWTSGLASAVSQPLLAARRALPGLLALALWTGAAVRVGAQPVVTNVTAAQQPLPSKLVDIYYVMSDTNQPFANVGVVISKDSGATWTVPATNLTGNVGIVNLSSTPTTYHIVWNAGTDWDGHYTAHGRVRILANDAGLSVIPAGTFSMGDNLNGETDAPVHSVTISHAYYMDSTLVTGGHWNRVVEGFAQLNGYDLAAAQQDTVNGEPNGPGFKFDNHPVQSVTWFDVVKWCNARSQFEGATPVYYTDAGCTMLYTNGLVDSVYVKANANGYRLPTEAEWEKAARGGLNGQRFPWGNMIEDGFPIAGGLANYFGDTNDFSYDLGPNGYNSAYALDPQPYTSPVASFLPNNYGLYDMAGNVREWCWDWYDPNYYASGQTDPQGPPPPQQNARRVLRGGSWLYTANESDCAWRAISITTFQSPAQGFRCVRTIN